MSVLRPRTRLVNFRLSEDEFERLKASCALHGSRSISDFARSSVLDRMEAAPTGSQFGGQGRLLHLDHKVAELEMRVTQIAQVLTPAPPPLLYEAARSAAGGG